MGVNKAKSNIVPFWQPVGISTNRLSQIIGKHYSLLSSHTGTLDPMAEGVIIVLLGDKRFEKYEYSNCHKYYEFEVILGLSTDSFDGMGIITGQKKCSPNKRHLQKVLDGMVGHYKQHVPMYSAVKYRGKKLFELGHSKTAPEKMPVKEGQIFNIKLLDLKSIKIQQITENILKRLNIIKGNFRQPLIIEQWKEYAAQYSPAAALYCIKISVEMSKGLYVRSLSQDICKKIDCLGFTFSIKRTRNGVYIKKDCLTVNKLFGTRRNFDDLISGVKS